MSKKAVASFLVWEAAQGLPAWVTLEPRTLVYRLTCMCPFSEWGLPCPLLAGQGRAWLTLTLSVPGLGVAVRFPVRPADSCSCPLPVRAAGLVWRFLSSDQLVLHNHLCLSLNSLLSLFLSFSYNLLAEGC